MAKLLFTILLVATTVCTQAQNVGIGTTSPATSAALEISGNNKGLLIPRTSATGRTGIATPPKGLMVYDTTHSAFYYYDGGRWLPFYQQNYDSATIDYSSTAVAAFNLSTINGDNSSVTNEVNSGFIYDNGGPAGNYLANSNSSIIITKDDSTLLIKINLEEMAAEVSYDSLFLIYGVFGNGNTLDTIGISGIQTGNYSFNTSVKILFKSNNINQFAGFKIRWARIKVNTTLQQPVPLYGWHFNIQKQAAMGGVQQNNNWHTDSVGLYSLSYGNGAKAKGYASLATGYYTSASGRYSTAMGNRTTAPGDYATAIGWSTNATGTSSTAMGNYADATGSSSIALGNSVNATGTSSVALGIFTDASGTYSTAIGFDTRASGFNSTTMGYNTLASGAYSTAIGDFTVARAYGSLIIGRYNDSIAGSSPTSWVSTDPLFIMGNGTANNARSNAMVVLKNGNVAIGDNNTPVNRLHITGGTDLDLTDNSGFITLGGVGAGNMVFDNNEIQVRNNGASAHLYLQTNGGQVMIGGGEPSHKLTINGNAFKSNGTSAWEIPSDARLKKDIRPYNDGLAFILKINPVWFRYNEVSGFDMQQKNVGILAQDLQKIAPYMISESATRKAPDGTGYLSVDNGAMTYMLINAVKEQQQQIEALNKEMEKLKATNK